MLRNIAYHPSIMLVFINDDTRMIRFLRYRHTPHRFYSGLINPTNLKKHLEEALVLLKMCIFPNVIMPLTRDIEKEEREIRLAVLGVSGSWS